MNRIQEAFARARARREVALFPYLTAGFPNQEESPRLLAAMVRAGADGIEIGVPFSDPMADGSTLQRANEEALRAGADLETAFQLARQVRALSPTVPVVFMSYYNPILARGEHEFSRQAVESGADGLIVPDLPPEECSSLRAACLEAGLDYIFMLAPTSSDQRIRMVAELARGFIYCVSLVGVTGARAALSDQLGPFLQRVRVASNVPLLVGFGISRAEHLLALRGKADGAVVASALADLVERTPAAERESAVFESVRELKLAFSDEENDDDDA